MSRGIDRYLAELRRELLRRGVAPARFIEEAREHLIDAMNAAARRDLPPGDAEQDAVARFGPAKLIARRYAAESLRPWNRALLIAAIAIGLAIAWVDSRPTWDDAGVTAFGLMLASGIFGLVAPRHPWRWALAIGIWIPLHAIVLGTSTAPWFTLPIILAFPTAGAYGGKLVRHLIAPPDDSIG